MLTHKARCTRRVIPAALVALFALASAANLLAKPPIGPDEGIPCVPAADAHSVIDRVADVFGRVNSVDPKRSLVVLRMNDGAKAAFSIVIYRDKFDNFDGDVEKMYLGKLVKVHGTVSTYAGTPQIYATSSNQIEILSNPPTVIPLPKVAQRPKSSEITVAAYNILNLFDEVDDPYRNDDSTPPKPRKQLEAVAKEIRTINADVLALEEVESRGYLQRFVDVFLPDMGYEVVHVESNDVRGIDACLLSRVPIGRVISHRHLTFPDANGKPMRFNRDLLRVEVRPPDTAPFEMWLLHLKSNYDGKAYAEPLRLGEAREVRKLLDSVMDRDPSARILVCGDFNDTRDSHSVKTIIGTGTNALTAFSDDIPKSMQISYNKEPYRSMIDFILASPGMAGRFVKGSYMIPQGSVDTTGSDHNPVIAKFRLGN